MKTMAAGAFKAHCLAVMDEVQAKRQAVLITKRGKPVAKLVPVEQEKDDIFGFSRAKARSKSRATLSPPHSVPKNGAIFIDSARHACGDLARARLSADITGGRATRLRKAREKDRGLAVSDITLVEIVRLASHEANPADAERGGRFYPEVERRFIGPADHGDASRCKRSSCPQTTRKIRRTALSGQPHWSKD